MRYGLLIVLITSALVGCMALSSIPVVESNPAAYQSADGRLALIETDPLAMCLREVAQRE